MGRFDLPAPAPRRAVLRPTPRQVGCDHLLPDGEPCIAGHLCSFCEAELAGVFLVRSSDAVADLVQAILRPLAPRVAVA